MHKDTYLEIESACTGIYKEKGSKFIAYCFPVHSEQDIKDRLEEIAKKEHSARHYCYAYILDADKSVWRANDDGEPGAASSSRDRRGARTVATQADTGPEWTQWDMGRALQALRSANPGVVQRTLRKLHVRLWHAPAQRLRDLLSAAGLPNSVVNAAQDVLDTCRSCREWERRGRKPVASLFNEGVQIDLLFMEDGVVAHLICLCIRFAQAEFTKGPPQSLTSPLPHSS